MMTLPPALLRSLAAIVGEPHLLTGDATAGFAVDWTGRFRGRTPAVVRPRDTAEVAAVLALCADAGIPVVPQGGNTGLVGGGVPLQGEVVLSVTRLNQTGPVDQEAAQITVGAGVTLQRVADADPDLDLGILIASRDSATVGGAVATNAGGVRVLRFGPMRAQLRGLEAVLADGTVVSHLAGLIKDNTGRSRWGSQRPTAPGCGPTGNGTRRRPGSSASRSSSTSRCPPRGGCGSRPRRPPWSPPSTRARWSSPSATSPTATCT
jgi:FAD/FMN-containing dehydrogenase